MKWKKIDKQNGWRKRFAFFPMKIEDEWIWLEWYWQKFEGYYFNVCRFEDKPF